MSDLEKRYAILKYWGLKFYDRKTKESKYFPVKEKEGTEKNITRLVNYIKSRKISLEEIDIPDCISRAEKSRLLEKLNIWYCHF